MSEKNRKRESEETRKDMPKKSREDEPGSDDFISFSELPTLRDITLVSIATTLWNNFCATENLDKPKRKCTRRFALKSVGKLKEIVLNQPNESFLPHFLKLDVCNIIKPIGVELSSWYDSNDHESCPLKDLRKVGCSIHWTAEGTIDKVKSLKEFFKNVKLSKVTKKTIHTYYALASKYCIEEYISYFWKEIPSNERFLYEGICGIRNENDIFLYWASVMKNDLSKVNQMFNFAPDLYDQKLNIHQNMISWSISVGNPFAFKYFWQKVTQPEINACIGKWLEQAVSRVKTTSGSYQHLEYNSFAYIMCFLFSHLRDKQRQKKFLHKHFYFVLTALFRSWPFSHLYLTPMSAMLNFLEDDVYITVLTVVVERMGIEKDAQYVFRAIWNASPQKKTRSFLKRDHRVCHPKVLKTLIKLVNVDDLCTALTIVDDMNCKQKEWVASNIILYPDFKKFLASNKDLNLIDPLLRKVLSSDKNIESLKRYVLLHYTENCPLFYELIKKNDYGRVEALLQWAFNFENEIQSFKENNLNPLKMCSSLICDDYGTINRFLRWYFQTEEEIQQFERGFLCEESSKHLKSILFRFATFWDGWSRFDKFRSLCLFAGENLAEFKKLCLDSMQSVVVENSYFAFASRLLDWCLETTLEVNRFKSDLLLSDCGIKIIDLTDDSGWDKVMDLIEWASPLSSKSVSALKLLLSTDEKSEWERRRKGVFKLLDTVVKATSSSEVESK